MTWVAKKQAQRHGEQGQGDPHTDPTPTQHVRLLRQPRSQTELAEHPTEGPWPLGMIMNME